MSDDEISQRMENLEAQAQDVIRRMERLSREIERFTDNSNHNTDKFVQDLSVLRSMVIGLFPDAILEFDGGVVIPGIAGAGEIGPDNVQYPNYVLSASDGLLQRRKRIIGVE